MGGWCQKKMCNVGMNCPCHPLPDFFHMSAAGMPQGALQAPQRSSYSITCAVANAILPLLLAHPCGTEQRTNCSFHPYKTH